MTFRTAGVIGFTAFVVFAVPLLAAGGGTAEGGRTAGGGQTDLSTEHRKWLEEEVVYIITDKEKDIFSQIETYEERQNFIESFWKRRDPSRATQENEFKTEHYRRIDYANTKFSKHTFNPGWKTDQGRMYIILGEPRDRKAYEAYQYLVYIDLWFYQGDVNKGLPSFFYLMFFKQHDVGEYKLYSPLIDGPISLIRGTPGFSNDSREAVQLLGDISSDIAHASLAYDTSDYPDFSTGRPSIGSELVVARIEESPKRAVRTDYADAWTRYRDRVSSEYSFNFIPSRGVFAVLAGPMGAPFLHYSIELDPTYFVLETDETKFYTTLDISLEVTDQDGNRVVANDKEVYVELTESQIKQLDTFPFAYQDDFPVIPGDYSVSVILRNRTVHQYTVVERRLTVDPVLPNEPGLGELIVGFGSEQTLDDAEEGELRTFQIGKVRIHPASDNVFTLGETLHVFAQVLGATPEDKLRLALVDETEAVLDERSVPMNFEREGALIETFELKDMTGGRYLLRGQLVGPEGRVLAEKTAPVEVSPRNALARPWVHRRSFDTKVPGLLPLTLGEQLLSLKRIELAQKALEVAVAANNPDLPQARWRLAGIYIGWREPDRALELLQPLETQFSNQYEVVTGLGFAYYFKEDFARAVDYLERAVMIRPPGTSLLNTLGDCHQKLGNSDRAKEAFESSLELNPNQDEIRGKLDSLNQE